MSIFKIEKASNENIFWCARKGNIYLFYCAFKGNKSFSKCLTKKCAEEIVDLFALYILFIILSFFSLFLEKTSDRPLANLNSSHHLSNW